MASLMPGTAHRYTHTLRKTTRNQGRTFFVVVKVGARHSSTLSTAELYVRRRDVQCMDKRRKK